MFLIDLAGLSIFLAVLNILLGILTLSYLHPKKQRTDLKLS